MHMKNTFIHVNASNDVHMHGGVYCMYMNIIIYIYLYISGSLLVSENIYSTRCTAKGMRSTYVNVNIRKANKGKCKENEN